MPALREGCHTTECITVCWITTGLSGHPGRALTKHGSLKSGHGAVHEGVQVWRSIFILYISWTALSVHVCWLPTGHTTPGCTLQLSGYFCFTLFIMCCITTSLLCVSVCVEISRRYHACKPGCMKSFPTVSSGKPCSQREGSWDGLINHPRMGSYKTHEK